MTLLIGVDEAGYGPNYGPLAVAATAWRVAGEASGFRLQASGKRSQTADAPLAATRRSAVAERVPTARMPDLYKLLRRVVVRSPGQCARRLAIADSKALYKPGLGLRQLERGVLAAVGCLLAGNAAAEESTRSVGDLFDATRADPDRRRHELPCHADDAWPLPLETPADDVTAAAARLQDAGAKNGVALAAVRVRLVFPAEFNALVDQFGTKGAALSHVTLALVRQVVDECGAGGEDAPARFDDRVLISLDKHGGRNRYAALVQHHFPDSWIDVLDESRAASRYHWTHAGAAVEATFRTRGEELLPTALASMTAKYHRELSMRAFNAFWTERVPGLRPTCGYPADARRFKQDIAAMQHELGIDDRMLWRCR
jgi:ribonuclease HII